MLINTCVVENIGKLWLQANHEIVHKTIESYSEKELQKYLQLPDEDFIYVITLLCTKKKHKKALLF